MLPEPSGFLALLSLGDAAQIFWWESHRFVKDKFSHGKPRLEAVKTRAFTECWFQELNLVHALATSTLQFEV